MKAVTAGDLLYVELPMDDLAEFTESRCFDVVVGGLLHQVETVCVWADVSFDHAHRAIVIEGQLRPNQTFHWFNQQIVSV